MEKIITQCSNCQAKFKLGSEKLGKKIKCPKCKSVFVVEAVGAKRAAAPAPPKPEPAPVPEAPQAAPAPPPVPEPAPAPEPAQEIMPLENRPKPLKVKDFFETQSLRFIPEKAEGADIHIAYNITGDEGGEWIVKITDGTMEVKEGADPGAKSQVRMSSKTYLKIAIGKLDSRVAFMLGKVKVKGDRASLAAYRQCFKVAKVK